MVCSTHKYVPELPRENRVREVKRRGRFDGRQKLLRVLCLNSLNNVRLPTCRYRQSPRRNTTVQVATFVLNDCLAYLRFGRYWPIVSLCGDSKIRSLSLCSGRACCAGPAAHQHRTIISPNPLRRDRERESRAPGA